ncbi:MAG: ribulose bisphosphate carboxylase small subunit [Cyanobacteria bacterium QS_8_64_29]|jgi:ribulose-bisphosphate carboxylase small chain|nr:MAG: ribulose bisphosphate carboxylase small subunit [Cyanobacteria bacterium QS_8_64_29]
MRLTQGTFSFLPDFTDDEIRAQVQYAINNGWVINVEFTDDPHPRNNQWEMWGLPMFDMKDPEAIMYEINECRKAYPNYYIKVNAYDNTLERQSMALSFIVNRPTDDDPGFLLQRQETNDRHIHYMMTSYAVAENPAGERYSK